MAGIEGAALGAAVSLGLGAYNATSGFSARHDLAHDAQVAETRKLVDDFEKLHKSGDMADEDYDVYLDRKGIAIQSGKAYRDSISDFKSTSSLNLIKKWRKKEAVRKRKRQAREANQNLHDHYYDSSSCSSDASSITAESGSPPQAQNIRGWADEVVKEDGADDEEDWRDNVEGGYHPVEIGDKFSDGRYVVVRKLGWGHSSTVWLAKDLIMSQNVALKIIKSSLHYTEIAMSQIELLKLVVALSVPPPSQSHPGGKHLLLFLDHFRHVGPNGVHVCMVFEVFGENLLDLIKLRQNKRLALPFVKQIAKEIFLGLDYMHRVLGVVHTNLTPENIYVCIGDNAIPSIELKVMSSIDRQTEGSSRKSEAAVEKVAVKIANLASSTGDHPHKIEMRTQQYSCPEVILGAKFGPSSDIWSVSCVLFELITGDVEADALAAFLRSMLHLDPEKRANASELTHHEWLEDTDLQSWAEFMGMGWMAQERDTDNLKRRYIPIPNPVKVEDER